jgi:4-aminobutyrate aminotransferase-like enzyme
VAGKGITSGLPLAAVIGPSKYMNIFAPGSMTSTHTGNPIICAASLANLKLIKSKKLVRNAANLGKIMAKRLQKIWRRYPDRVGYASSIGLVGALQMVARPGTTEPDHDTTFDIVKYCVEHGLMLFGPVGDGGGSVKLSPPIAISRQQLEEGLDVLEEAFDAVLG